MEEIIFFLDPLHQLRLPSGVINDAALAPSRKNAATPASRHQSR